MAGLKVQDEARQQCNYTCVHKQRLLQCNAPAWQQPPGDHRSQAVMSDLLYIRCPVLVQMHGELLVCPPGRSYSLNQPSILLCSATILRDSGSLVPSAAWEAASALDAALLVP